jgi:hypothetical protein
MWMRGTDGQVKYCNLDSAQSLYAIDNGDGTFSVGASFSDFGLRLIDAGPYTSQAQAVAAIEAHLGTNLSTTF